MKKLIIVVTLLASIYTEATEFFKSEEVGGNNESTNLAILQQSQLSRLYFQNAGVLSQDLEKKDLLTNLEDCSYAKRFEELEAKKVDGQQQQSS